MTSSTQPNREINMIPRFSDCELGNTLDVARSCSVVPPVVLVVAFFLASPANAATFVSIVGDCDGFGSEQFLEPGVTEAGTYDDNLPYHRHAVDEPGEQDLHFNWCVATEFNWVHTFSLPADAVIQRADLQLNSYGVQDADFSSTWNNLLFLDGDEVAQAFQNVNAGTRVEVTLHTVPVGSLSDGEVAVRVFSGAHPGFSHDCVFFDYSELVITYSSATPISSSSAGSCQGAPITPDPGFPPQNSDGDADGVLDDLDVCSGTVIPESVPTRRLGVNRFALVDGDGDFNTTSPPGGGGGPGLSFNIEDTAGCSCEQIIEALSLGRGHEKFGCSISAMEAWVALVNP